MPCPIKSVEVKGRYVLFTLNSGDEIKIPLYNAITIKFEETTIGMNASSQIDLLYTLTGGDNVKVLLSAKVFAPVLTNLLKS